MTRVLVTGANGFVGSQLVRALMAHGDEVTCLVRRTSSLEMIDGLNVDLAYGDVTDRSSVRSAIAGTEIVYHVAGCTRTVRVEDYYRVNGHGTDHVLWACTRQTTPPVVVIVSSLAAAGPAVGGRDGRMRTETDPPQPVSHYGRSKRLGERMAEQFADRLPITVVRPPVILGEGDRMGLDMFRSVDRFRIHMVPGIARYRISLIHVADLAQLLILAARRGRRLPAPEDCDASPAQGYYFAACNEHPAYPDLGRMIGRALGHRYVCNAHVITPLVWIVAGTIEIVGRALGRPLYLNLDKAREVTAGSWVCSPQRAIDELGFAVAAPLTERLRQTAEWYREKGWL